MHHFASAARARPAPRKRPKPACVGPRPVTNRPQRASHKPSPSPTAHHLRAARALRPRAKPTHTALHHTTTRGAPHYTLHTPHHTTLLHPQRPAPAAPFHTFSPPPSHALPAPAHALCTPAPRARAPRQVQPAKPAPSARHWRRAQSVPAPTPRHASATPQRSRHPSARPDGPSVLPSASPTSACAPARLRIPPAAPTQAALALRSSRTRRRLGRSATPRRAPRPRGLFPPPRAGRLPGPSRRRRAVAATGSAARPKRAPLPSDASSALPSGHRPGRLSDACSFGPPPSLIGHAASTFFLLRSFSSFPFPFLLVSAPRVRAARSPRLAAGFFTSRPHGRAPG